VAAAQLRGAADVSRSRTLERALVRDEVTLVELVDRVLNKGVVVTGDITLSVADVDLVYVGLRLLLASAATLEGEAE
jgi:hypothetical protein